MKNQGIWGTLTWRFKYGGVYFRLVLINSAIFLSIQLITIIAYLFKVKPQFQAFISEWFIASSNGMWMLEKPWTAITYMFLHANFFHILFNMITLYFAGNMFQSLLNGRRLLALYIMGGLFALFMHMFAMNVFPVFAEQSNSLILGASGAISAIFIALAVYAPNMEVALFGVFRVRLFWLAAIFLLLDIIRIQDDDGVARFAHLGGALFGYLYIVLLKKGTDLAKTFYMVVDAPGRLFNRKQPRMRVVKNQKPPTKKATSSDFSSMNSTDKQRVIDQILDKISKSGYDSLSAREKEILFKASNEK